MPGPVGIETFVGPSGRGGGGGVVSPAYTILVKTDNAGTSSSTSFTLPATGTYDIEWGDGTRELAQTGVRTHDYGTAGEYKIWVTGGLTAVIFNNGGDRLKLLEIQNWGSPVWSTFNGAYRGCSNLRITASDLPNSGTVTNFAQAWLNCTSLTSFPLIDTSSGTSFVQAWRDCSSLTSFPLIDTSSGTNFIQAWLNCSSLTSFSLIDTSSGTNFAQAWFNCSSLTSFPLIDTSSGTSFSVTWFNCSSLTSFPLLSFASMTTGVNCFLNATLPTETWSQLLINTEADNTGTAVTWHGGNSKYNTAGGVARAALLARTTGWTITDGGAA